MVIFSRKTYSCWGNPPFEENTHFFPSKYVDIFVASRKLSGDSLGPRTPTLIFFFRFMTQDSVILLAILFQETSETQASEIICSYHSLGEFKL